MAREYPSSNPVGGISSSVVARPEVSRRSQFGFRLADSGDVGVSWPMGKLRVLPTIPLVGQRSTAEVASRRSFAQNPQSERTTHGGCLCRPELRLQMCARLEKAKC